METIVPANAGDPAWRVCLPATNILGNPASNFYQLSVLAWAISPTGAVTPITPFGRHDTTRPWVLADPFGNFIVMPHGPVLRSHNETSDYFATARRQGAV